jgi:hypothetical protein
MPRLSLYRPEKGNDYKFIDRTAWEMFQVGGVDVLIHKYLGPGGEGSVAGTKNAQGGTVEDPFRIQDVLFLENRDRKYDPDVFLLRGVYNIQDLDFNLSQFGLFLQNDTIFITFHINDTIEKIGRKLISGDVIELPHLKDEHALNDLTFALKRFYVIEDVNRAAEGFSVTWYPHLYRAKCVPLVDSQEFKDILDDIANREGFLGSWNPGITYYPGDIVEYEGIKYNVIAEVTGIAPPDSQYYERAETLRDITSTYEREMQLTSQVLDLAEKDAPLSGYDTTSFFTLQLNEQGRAELVTVDTESIDASIEQQGIDENGDPAFVGPSASSMLQTARQSGYNGYITEDGKPPNGAPFTSGIAFPGTSVEGQYHLRTDYMPNRLFRFNGRRWVKIEDNLRMTMSNTDDRQTQKTSFINNNTVNNIDGKDIQERQSLSKALRPEADE